MWLHKPIQFATLFSIIGAGCAGTPQLHGNEPFAYIVARVNGEVITRSQYADGLRLIETRLQKGLSGPELHEAFAKERRDLLRTLIDDRLLTQRAKVLNIWPPHEAIKYLESLRQEQKLPDLEALNKWMIREGIDRDELKDTLNRQSLRNQIFRREVYWKVENSISDDEIRQYYESHKENFAKKNGGFDPLTDVRNEVHDRIFASKVQQAVQEYLSTLRRQAIIEVKPGYVDTGAIP
jgi:hypothetical protein